MLRAKRRRQQDDDGAAFAFDLGNVDSLATAAAETWDTYATPFLDPAEASAVEALLGNRSDVACLRADGRRGDGDGKARFVFTHPDLADTTSPTTYCAVLAIGNYDVFAADPWPNVLTSIGLDVVREVGDVVVDSTGFGSTVAYVAVDPAVVKTCQRLLPKELPGVGVTVEELMVTDDDDENDNENAYLPDTGVLQDMEFQRLDKRSQKKR